MLKLYVLSRGSKNNIFENVQKCLSFSEKDLEGFYFYALFIFKYSDFNILKYLSIITSCWLFQIDRCIYLFIVWLRIMRSINLFGLSLVKTLLMVI